MFEYSEEQIALKEAARDFARVVLAPHCKADDETETFRKDLFHALGENGFCGIPAPEAYDGLGLGYEALREINPGLVMASISPFGQAGPYRDWHPSAASARGSRFPRCHR